jgi:hypothetical protein
MKYDIYMVVWVNKSTHDPKHLQTTLANKNGYFFVGQV